MQYSRVQGHDQQTLFFLNQASDALFSSLTLEDELVFDKISHLIVPHLADWFAIDLYDEANEKLELLTVAHHERAKLSLAYELRNNYPPDLQADTGIGGVLKSGKPLMYAEIPEVLLKSTARDQRHAEILTEIGFRSVILLPMKSRNVPFGVITFVATNESGKIYSEEDLTLIESFANKVAIAIDNHRLYKKAQREINHSKQVELEIVQLLLQSKQKQEWLDSLIRTIPGIVWETELNPEDDSEKMIFVSKFAEEMLGYSREKLLSLNFWWSIIHPEDLAGTGADRRSIFEKGYGHNQYRMLTADGRVIWTEARSQVLYADDGKPRGVRGVTFDITRMKDLESRKDEFISIASHELKTPITSAKLIVQILNEYAADLSEESRYFVKKLDDQLDKLVLLINSMLDVNRLHQAKLEFRDEPFNLNEMVSRLVEELKIVNRNEINVRGKLSGMLKADKERVAQVMMNLLTNAIKYSHKNDPVEVKISQTDEEVTVSVSDKGVGIEEKYLGKVFEKFFRVPDPQIKYISGMGLGLNIAHQIINHYKGKMWAESKPSKGSTFYFSLPAALIQSAE